MHIHRRLPEPSLAHKSGLSRNIPGKLCDIFENPGKRDSTESVCLLEQEAP
jgi:hypothetical protein